MSSCASEGKSIAKTLETNAAFKARQYTIGARRRVTIADVSPDGRTGEEEYQARLAPRARPKKQAAQQARPAGPRELPTPYLNVRPVKAGSTPPSRPASKLDHRKFRFADVAQRAAPVVRNRGEAGARGDAFFGQTFFLVVDPAANQTHPAFIFCHFRYFAHDALISLQCNDPPSLPLFLARRRPAILQEFVRCPELLTFRAGLARGRVT